MRPAKSYRLNFFRAIARVDVERPWLVLTIALMLSVASVILTKERLQFHTGQDDLISANNRSSRDYLRYTSEFPDLDGLVVVIRTKPSAAPAELFADTLAARLNADHANVKTVFYRVDPGMMGDRALLYLSADELKQFDGRIRENLGLLRRYSGDPTLANFFGIVNGRIDDAIATQMAESSIDSFGEPADPPPAAAAGAKTSAAGPAAGASTTDTGSAIDLRLLDSVLGGMLAPGNTQFDSPWNDLGPAGEQNGVLGGSYVASDNGKYLLMEVAPGDGVKDGPDPVDAIQAELDHVRADFPDVEAGMTGGPALARTEETSTAHDMALASGIAITGNILLLVIPFRGVVEPLFTLIALMVGVTWSFGFTTLAVGHLNLLSAVFTSVLAGIGINFPIHLMARYDEARRRGAGVREALELAVVNTGTGVFASACIMALAFLMPIFTDFKGIAELGLVSAAGLFMCLISALLVFPALIAIRDRNRPTVRAPRLSIAPRRSWLEKLFARPRLIVGIAAAATLAALFLVRGVSFDQNLLKLQASGAEAVKYENLLLKDSGRSSWFAVSLASGPQAAIQKAAAFRKLPEVADAESIATYIPNHQAQKRALLASLGDTLAAVKLAPIPLNQTSGALLDQLTALNSRITALARIDPSSGATKTSALIGQAILRLKSASNPFTAYQRALAQDLDHKLGELKRELAPTEINEGNLPPVLRARFIGRSGLYLVQVYPRGDIWADAPLQRFVGAVSSVDPDVTGPPIQTYNIATVMRRGYERAAVLALIAVFIFVFADFRNLRDTSLATVPLLFGGLWLLEAMGLLGWEFNLANLFAVPIIIGTGVDNGVNMLYRWREERDKSSLILTKAVGKSVIVCSLTTIAGFAALIPATHRGISSLGWVLSLGVALILLATLIVLPALFELFGSRIDRAHDPDSAAAQGSHVTPAAVGEAQIAHKLAGGASG